MEVAATFTTMVHCVEAVVGSQPHVVLVDITRMEDTNSIRLLHQQFPHVHILIYTKLEDDEIIYACILAGVGGYLLTNTILHSLVKSIHEMKVGGRPMSPQIARRVFSMLQRGSHLKKQPSAKYSNLTAREKEILNYLTEGLSHKMIGFKLNIAYSTVRSHIKNICKKVEVKSLTELVGKALRENIVLGPNAI